MPALLLACSPRQSGNCDTAAALTAEAFAQGGKPLFSLFLRQHTVLPCIACDACQREARRGAISLSRLEDADQSAPAVDTPAKTRPGGKTPAFGCPLTRKDDSAILLDALWRTSQVIIIAPIYFYHLPAIFKALIDRTQPFWAMRQNRDPRIEGRAPRPCHVILAAGRPKGKKLFEGSLLTLKFALANLGLVLAEPLLLRGVDGPGDLSASPKLVESVRRYAVTAQGGE